MFLRIDKLVEKYKVEYSVLVANSELRWLGWRFDNKIEGYANYNSGFLKSLDDLSNFFKQRPKSTLLHMKNFLGLNGDLVDLDIKVIGNGKVQINTIIPEINNGKWSGQYFVELYFLLKNK